jgi:hypothetical protein
LRRADADDGNRASDEPMLTTAIAHQMNAAETAVDGEEDFSSVIGEMEHLARVRRNSRPADELSRLKNQPAQ